MEAASVGAGANNHLQSLLSQDELVNIPNPVVNKINGYIEQKFEEYLTSKALHETSKSQIGDKIAELDSKLQEITTKYEEVSSKLASAEQISSEYCKQLENVNRELERAREKITRLESENTSLKSARDAAVDERNDLTRIVERRDMEIQRLIDNGTTLSQQLQAAIDAKCEAVDLYNTIQTKELSLQYREKRNDHERALLNSQIAGLTEEVNRLTSELQTVRLNNTSRLINLETQLAEKVEELKSANETINQSNETQRKLNNRIESLTQKLKEQMDVEDKITQNFKIELEAKTKLASLFQNMYDESDAKVGELAEGITTLKKLLNDATDKFGELETKYLQAEKDHEELIEKKDEVISSLKNELELANNLLKSANEQNLDMALSDLAPSAATASKLLKSGMSLTQVYSQLVKVTDELAQEKEENRRLNITITSIVQELEEKAPELQKQRTEYLEAMESNAAFSQQIDSLVIECNGLRDDYNETSKIANHYSRENSRLKGELADLGRQVCFLLKEIEQTRGGPLPNGDHNSSHETNMSANTSDPNASHDISKTLVTFRDIQELQNNNQKLLRMVRDLTEKQEELERHKQQFESGDMQNKIETLKGRVTELTEAQERQTKMVNGLIRQRDMFKKLYHDLMKGKRHEVSVDLESSEMDTSDIKPMNPQTEKSVAHKPNTMELSVIEAKYKETEKLLEMLKEEYKTYKEEKVANERMLFEQIDNMRQEISKLTACNSKCASTSEYNNERLKILQTNITTYKKQISSLEEKNKTYSTTIAKHEVSLQHLRDEVLNAQSKLAATEIANENLKLEIKLLKDTEVRLRTENDILTRERQGQAMLFKNLEFIKASMERSEVDNKAKVETRLDEATRECAALRRRLQEEQDRFRELAAHLERQTETAKSRMQEEKDVADQLRAELTQLRQDIIDKNKANEDLTNKLKMALSPNSDGTFDASKKISELENRLVDKDTEIKALQDQLRVSKEHIKQYCDISECAEKELKNLNNEYNDYKAKVEPKLAEYEQDLQKLQDKCSELEAELSLHNTERGGNIDANAIAEILNLKEELKTVTANFESCQTELNACREEVNKLSVVAQTAEEKYANEMILHSTDIQALSHVKQELTKAQNEINELVALKNSAIEKMETEKSSWIEREKMLAEENQQLLQRFKDLNDQNALLHDQIQALGTQLSVTHASRSMSDSINESGNDSNINISISEDEVKSSEQLFQIVKYLRKEKDIAMAKYDILQAETTRLKSQLELTEKKLDDTKLVLAAEREKSEVSMVTINKQSDVLRKVETLNALTDSNRMLREERDSLSKRVEELQIATKSLEEQISPLQEKITELTSKNETLQSENVGLKADCSRWRARVNTLVERANKISPEDWKRLQTEREALAKMLTNEKENIKKLNEQLTSIKVEKTKLEEQYSTLSRQHSSLIEEDKKVKEELQTLKDDIARLTEQLTELKAEHNQCLDKNNKISEELSSMKAALIDTKNKEANIKKIAKKYKAQYEELAKTLEEEKLKTDGEAAAANAANADVNKKMEERLNELQAQLAAEKATNEALKQELEVLEVANSEKEEKAKQVLKQAKTKIVQLTEAKSNLSRELNESRSKIETIEQSSRDEQDLILAAIRSQYEGSISRLEKERNEAQAEKTREIEALQQKINMLQRQLSNQSSSSKQQTTTEKTATDPPTANIKPMAGVSQQSVTTRGRVGETPLASIRPMAQVGPTAPHDAHTTEYMPASSSRPIPRAAVTASTAPPESTQDMDTSEVGMGSSGSSDNTAQSSSHSQAPQQAVALVMPRIEQPSGASSSGAVASVPASTSAAAANVTAGVAAAVSANVAPASGVASGAESAAGAGVSTSLAPEARPAKRTRMQIRPHPAAKRTRLQVQGFERSVEVEYQVPTSSRCDQDDEGVIVVDSEEDDERCTGTMYREGEDEEEDMEEEQEVEGGEEEEEEAGDNENAALDRQESPAQSPEAGEESSLGEGAEPAEGGAEREPAPAHPQIEAISSGTEPSGALSLTGSVPDDGDDSIVPSTPTLYVPRRNDGFGEAVVSPLGGTGSSGRFTFAEAGAASHHDTHADLAAALPPPQAPAAHQSHPPGGTEEEEQRAEEETPAVSSQGSEPSSPHQGAAEEGREAEATAIPPARRRTPSRPPHHAHSPHQRWMPSADSESGMRGRGARSRGRPPRRPHNYMRF